MGSNTYDGSGSPLVFEAAIGDALVCSLNECNYFMVLYLRFENKPNRADADGGIDSWRRLGVAYQDL